MSESHNNSCDVLIVGGGPAGSTCAFQLVKTGLDVVVMDRAKFPRDKVCAGWITPQIVDSLQMDVSTYSQGRVLQPITSFRTGLIGGDAILTSFDRPVSYGIRRCEFDHWLLQRSGARLMQGESVRSLERDGAGWRVNGSLHTPLLVGAGGHFCPIARHLNESLDSEPAVVLAQEAEFTLTDEQAAGCRIEPEVPELYFCPDLAGYGWCFRKQNVLNIGLGREGERNLSSHVEQFVSWLRITRRIDFEIPIRFHGHAYRLHRDGQRRIIDDGVLLIGDSAGLAYAQSGEGIRPAVESALLAAATIREAAGVYGRAQLQPYADRLLGRFGKPASNGSIIPAPLRLLAARMLLRNGWLTRLVLLKRWFLHADLPALHPLPSE